MRRVHLFELEDQAWLPTALRDGITDYLTFMQSIARVDGQVIPHLKRLLASTGLRRVVDLCSGAGGPVGGVARALAPHGVRFTLTDLYPNIDALASTAAAAPDSISIMPEPVDARALPAELGGMRTLFMGFHHFHPDDAKRILADSFLRHQPIAVFELAERRLRTMMQVLPMFLAQLLTAPFQRPWRWSRLLLTYVVPLLPIAIVFDGLVSCLRAYTVHEMQTMVDDLDRDDWRWEIGVEPLSRTPGRLTYLLGYPG